MGTDHPFLAPPLAVDYAHFWLSLISPNSPAVQEERRKYAKLVGNVEGELYPILECQSSSRVSPSRRTDLSFVSSSFAAALTGRIGLGRPDYDEQPEVDEQGLKKNYTQQKAQSVMEMEKATAEEEAIMRNVSPLFFCLTWSLFPKLTS